ncbi:MAG: TldD/PmbA family protein [Gemmatimonadaceae bacterium]|nr:TldD/PmbA family protein [Gemmatimonadaceae bacterium]
MRGAPKSLFTAPLDGEFLTRDQAKALADRVLAFAKADETRVNIASGWTGNTRFAGNEITTSGGSTNTTVTVTSTVGRRRASAQTNILDDASLRRTVESAESLARLSPENPEIVPELGPQEYAAVNGYFDTTAGLDPERRAAATKSAIEASEAAGGAGSNIFVAGFLEANAGASAVATSRGLFAYHRATSANLGITARTPDGTGSGWSNAGARDWSRIDAAALGRTAAQKAAASRNPRAIEPGLYTVVLEPAAVADIMGSLLGTFNARANDEGRGTFSKSGGGTKLGEKIADERVTMYSDPADADLLAQPFAADGTPVRRVTYIENGILKEFAYDRFWAQKQGKAPTGGGGGFGGGGGGGFGGGAVKFVGGTQTTAELIAGTKRGILVTHFFYIRPLDQRTVMLTGLTRDGTFLIENGKITAAVKNFRWNESPLFLLSKIEEIGRAEPVGAGRVMPSLRAKDFNFTSLSDAV